MKYAIEKCKCIIGVDEYMKYVIGQKCMIVGRCYVNENCDMGCVNGG